MAVIDKIFFDLKIEGLENLKYVQSGAISVCNHVLFLDCTMVGLALWNKNIYYTTREESFQIPFVRRLIKVLRAIPIPKAIGNQRCFVDTIDKALKDGKIIHFYPEASLNPYNERIRNFKNGAFDFAVRNNVPVIPMVISFREPKGIRRFIKEKKDATLKILKPVIIEDERLNTKEKIEKLKNKVHEMMENEIL